MWDVTTPSAWQYNGNNEWTREYPHGKATVTAVESCGRKAFRWTFNEQIYSHRDDIRQAFASAEQAAEEMENTDDL